ncbi:MAG: ATP-dependent DNA helicase [Alphaproteobacteria bacterium]|nr:ATP-dependent DNA helicase [Alphaproteobacteria bacterium]MCB1839212.1 ATP-dependent DNA helicase [Alphaproteobacteria bacterium]
MNAQPAIAETAKISLPDVPALCVNSREAFLLTTDGEFKTLPLDQARLILHKKPVLLCHAPFTKARLELDEFLAFDVLELFAFVHPARFCVPTPAGLAKALFLRAPESFEDAPAALMDIAIALLKDLKNDPFGKKADPLAIASVMGLRGKGWPWTPYIFSALGETYDPVIEIHSRTALNVWKHLPEWAEDAPPPPPAHEPVSPQETKDRLNELLSRGDGKTETRSQQQDYAIEIANAFAPVREIESPNVVLAEAGTGVGKTLGYLAPASVWAEKNDAGVWISTYTKNLQRQIDSELDRLYPHPEVKDAYVTVRKGRENYLCLLNLEDMATAAATTYTPRHAVAAGIMARWAAATRDGDLSGPDFPGWLSGLLEFQGTYGLADRRGECIFSACDHYHRCFVERSIRKSRRARIVVANHALVMIQSALSMPGEDLPTRYVFDEAHHLFDAADSAFAAHLTAREMVDLRRWILGTEGGRKSRARGLKRRIEDLIAGDENAGKLLESAIHQARSLSAQGWSKRLNENIPDGPAEKFLAEVWRQVYARAEGRNGPYALETGLHPADPDLLDAATKLKTSLQKLQKPMTELARLIAKKLEQDEGYMDADTRKRLDALARSIERRTQLTLKGWIGLLDAIETGEPSPGFVDWLEIERIEGRAFDVGAYRHHTDPMIPFAASLRPHLHGMAVTSATLRDGSEEDGENWQTAQERTGALYFAREPRHAAFASPFDYKAQTRIFIVNDVRRDDPAQVAGAYRALFKASEGGGLGLFTSIQRLRAIHEKIVRDLEEAGLPLYAQHVDAIDTGTLVDMFRDDPHSCLLGTDAVRDGVDVPGDSLRLIVFDRVPWPRPTILHKARREQFGKKRFDDMITRLKLKQAYGRLIRRETDHGVFVILDPMLPSRLLGAFPPDTIIEKTGLAEVVKKTGAFLQKT